MAARAGGTARCPSCGCLIVLPPGRGLAATTHPCPRCGGAFPAVPDREPPPLYSWEVFANLYPSAPIPRGDPDAWVPAIAAALLAAAVLLAGLATTLTAVGVVTSAAAPGIVAGVVLAPSNGTGTAPLPGALVQLVEDQGAFRSTVTDGRGVFRFTGIAVGGITLNVTYRGLGSEQLQMFRSPFYASADLAHLTVRLGPSASGDRAPVVETAFPDLESYLASVGASAVLLGMGAVAVGMAARSARRGRIGPLVAAGGLGAALAPVACVMLGLVPAMTGVTVASGVAIVLGGVGGGLAAAYRWLLAPSDGEVSRSGGASPWPPSR